MTLYTQTKTGDGATSRLQFHILQTNSLARLDLLLDGSEDQLIRQVVQRAETVVLAVSPESPGRVWGIILANGKVREGRDRVDSW